MDLNAKTLYDVLSYHDFYERKSEFIKVAGGIEIHPAELEWLYNHGCYILKYRCVYQINHSRNYKGGFYVSLIYKSEKPITKRGRWNHAKASEINELLGFELLNV